MAEQVKEKAAPDGRGRRSRREVMAGAAGVLGVIAAQVVGRATPAQAGSDGDVVLGVDYQDAGAGRTGVTTSGSPGLRGKSTAPNGVGVFGEGDTGVLGLGYNGNGVFGQTSVNAASGVYGQNDSTGYGVAGRANNGTGVLADSATGTALLVTGKAQFCRSGKATVTAASGLPYVQVSLGQLSSSTFVVATVQGNPAGIWVKSVAVTPASSYFRIYLNKVPTKNVRVGFVLG